MWNLFFRCQPSPIYSQFLVRSFYRCNDHFRLGYHGVAVNAATHVSYKGLPKDWPHRDAFNAVDIIGNKIRYQPIHSSLMHCNWRDSCLLSPFLGPPRPPHCHFLVICSAMDLGLWCGRLEPGLHGYKIPFPHIL